MEGKHSKLEINSNMKPIVAILLSKRVIDGYLKVSKRHFPFLLIFWLSKKKTFFELQRWQKQGTKAEIHFKRFSVHFFLWAIKKAIITEESQMITCFLQKHAGLKHKKEMGAKRQWSVKKAEEIQENKDSGEQKVKE